MKNFGRIKNLSLELKDFFYGKEYPLFMGAIAIALHFLEMQFLGLAIFVFTACLILLFIDDLTPILPLAFLVIFNFHDYSKTSDAIFFVILSPAVICFILHPFRFKKKLFLGKYFLPQFSVCIALLLGGLFSPYFKDYKDGLLEIIAFGPIVLLVYFYFSNYLNPPKDLDINKYLCYLIVVMAIVPSVEQILMYGVKATPETILKNRLGWGSVNVVATLILLALPCAFYLLTKAKDVTFHLLLIGFLILSLFVSNSHACLGIALVLTPISIVYSIYYVRKQNKRYYINLLLLLLAFAILVVGICYTGGLLDDFIEKTIESLEFDSGRTALYLEAFDLFKESPVFGAGMGYFNHVDYGFLEMPLIYYNFHSTLFNVLGKMGIVGLLAYGYIYYVRYTELMKNHSPFNVFLTLGFGGYFCYAMVDTAEFNIMPCVIVITLIFTVLEIINKKERERFPLK